MPSKLFWVRSRHLILGWINWMVSTVTRSWRSLLSPTIAGATSVSAHMMALSAYSKMQPTFSKSTKDGKSMSSPSVLPDVPRSSEKLALKVNGKLVPLLNKDFIIISFQSQHVTMDLPHRVSNLQENSTGVMETSNFPLHWSCRSSLVDFLASVSLQWEEMTMLMITHVEEHNLHVK